MGQESRLEFQTVSYVRTSPCYICENQPPRFRPSFALSRTWSLQLGPNHQETSGVECAQVL
ncbi:hypothetical protein M405DRAFT_826376, partial [Rhizopogon salebrosus TDB-379]